MTDRWSRVKNFSAVSAQVGNPVPHQASGLGTTCGGDSTLVASSLIFGGDMCISSGIYHFSLSKVSVRTVKSLLVWTQRRRLIILNTMKRTSRMNGAAYSIAAYSIANLGTVNFLSHQVALQKARTTRQPAIAIIEGRGCANRTQCTVCMCRAPLKLLVIVDEV
jgi:hypothetical protein